MSLYNAIMGMNASADVLLAVVGLKQSDIERFRNVFVSDDGDSIEILTRTGGGNRADYPNLTMRKVDGWQGSSDDDFDSTYCMDIIAIHAEFREDVAKLPKILEHGLRPEFMQHIAKTIHREPTDGDLAESAYNEERAKLSRTRHVKANGHTFVPYDDEAMKTALEIAEGNDGKLRTAWGILPLRLDIKRDFLRWPNARDEDLRNNLIRWDVGYVWEIDEDYWKHCQERFNERFPVSMAKIAGSVERRREAA